MMKIVYKYELDMYAMNMRQSIQMPCCAKPIAAGIQGEKLVVWAEADSLQLKEIEPREFYVAFTGVPMGDMPWFQYLNTLQIDGFVLHVYYKTF